MSLAVFCNAEFGEYTCVFLSQNARHCREIIDSVLNRTYAAPCGCFPWCSPFQIS